MMNIQNYVRAQSLEEAYALNQDKRSCVLGGMLWLKMSDATVSTAIDLCQLGLDAIEETEEVFSLGAMATLRQLELHAGLEQYTQGAVREAVESIVGVQFRNMATVGGSIFGRFGFSDVLTAFLALDSYVELYHGGLVPLEDFSKMEKDRDILVRLIVKKKPCRCTYLSMRNSRTDFPVLTCAVSRLDGAYRAVIGARPALAKVVRDEQNLLARGIDGNSARAFGNFAADSIPTQGNVRGSAAYRTHLIRVLTERALLELGGENFGN